MSLNEAAKVLLQPRLKLLKETSTDCDYVCPLCERTNNGQHTLHINWDKKGEVVAICHSCGFGAKNAQYLVKSVLGYLPKSFYRASLRQRMRGSVEEIFRKATLEKFEPVPLPRGFVPLPVTPKTYAARKIKEYVEDRGVSQHTVETFGVGYVPVKHSRLYGYVVIPCHMGGKSVYWQGRRVFGDGDTKMYNPASTHRRFVVFGYDEALGADRVVLVEGGFDMLVYGEGAMMIGSKKIRTEQIRAVVGIGASRYGVCFDSDAYREGMSAANWLARRTAAEVRFMRLQNGDPASEGRRKVLAAWKRGIVMDVRNTVAYMMRPRERLRTPRLPDNLVERVQKMLANSNEAPR